MIEIRAVEAPDVPAVVELVRATLGEFGIVFGQGASSDDALSGLPRSYTAEGGAFFGAFEAAALIGTAGIGPVGPGVFELRKMYLRPAARGQGVGQRLLDACVGHVRSRGGAQIVLDTTEQMAAAIAFYERNGFVRDDSQRRASRCSRGYRRDL